MNTYKVDAFRKTGSTCPVRAILLLIDADTHEIAEGIAAARLARMRVFPGADEMEINSTHEVNVS